jgi:hypothetical protein
MSLEQFNQPIMFNCSFKGLFDIEVYAVPLYVHVCAVALVTFTR